MTRTHHWRPSRAFAVRYLKTLGVMAVFLVSLGGTYIGLHHKRIFPSATQIVIYGSDRCSITSALRAFLEARNVPYIYADVDKPLMSFELAAQLKLSEARPVALPVVLVGGRALERPAHELVLQLRRESEGIKGRE